MQEGAGGRPNLLSSSAEEFLSYTFKSQLSCISRFLFFQPLPEKFTFSKHFERFQQDFLKTRQKALDKFLNRITDHPVISFNDHVQKFLTAKAWVSLFFI